MNEAQSYETKPIKDAMEEQNLSVQDVSKLSGVSRPAIYQLLENKPTVKLETLMSVANAVKVPVSALFPEKEGIPQAV